MIPRTLPLLALLSACLGSDPAPDPYAACCAVCDLGKACGDSCIAREETCYEGPGCACNADGTVYSPPPDDPPGPSRDECCDPEDLPENCWYEHCDCESVSTVCVYDPA